jgi:hypothetical protein
VAARPARLAHAAQRGNSTACGGELAGWDGKGPARRRICGEHEDGVHLHHLSHRRPVARIGGAATFGGGARS